MRADVTTIRRYQAYCLACGWWSNGPRRRAMTPSAAVAGHYCGQTQPHGAHTWQTPLDSGSATFVGTYQCGGLTSIAPPGAQS